MKKKYPENPVCSYLNINSIRNKFENLNTMLNSNVDILSIAETKLDSSFPTSQFTMKGYKVPYRYDDTDKSGGLLTYIRSDIPSKLLNSFVFASDIQVIPVELNFRKCKWLFLSFYRPPRQNLNYFLSNISDALCFYNSIYSNILIIGDFNCTTDVPIFKEFLEYAKENLLEGALGDLH